MLELAVIADDLTGAADTAIQFRTVYAPVYLVDHRFLSIDAFGEPPQALAVFTASRGLQPADAHRAVLDACRGFGLHAPRRVYKKIDSAMRGNIGAELEAAMDALNIGMSFIAPAFVEQGRTTVGGVHCIHGTPVAKTEMRRDPIAPVCESSLPEWIGIQAHLPIAHIGLDVLNRGVAAAAAAIERAVDSGARHFTFDAAAVEDLDRIADLALNHYPQALLCGSAGLAKSMARALETLRRPPPARPRAIAPYSGHWLFVCGSASERLHRQVQLLAEQMHVGIEALEPAACHAADRPSDAWAAALRRAGARLAAEDVVITLASPTGDAPSIDSGRLMAVFADAVRSVIAAARPAGLFLSGGDTALAVLERLGVRGIRLECEMGSGLVFGSLMGGHLEGVPVVTKAGAFGPPDALLKLKEALSDAHERGRL